MKHKLTHFFHGMLLLALMAMAAMAADPGTPLNQASEHSDQKAGSFLIYNLYSSSASSASTANTRVSITNTNTRFSAFVHLFFVDGTSCSIADSYICLTPNQTASFLTSDVDPGTTGYIIALATDSNGVPTEFDWLIGDEFVKLPTGHASNLGAIAVSVSISPLFAFSVSGGSLARLEFDGICYNRLPRTLAANNIPSRADGNDTLFVFNRIGGNYSTGAGALGTLFGILYDDAESAYSFSVSGGCQLINSISDTFPRTVPRFTTVVPAGRSGWAKIWSSSTVDNSGFGGGPAEFRAITGAMINRNNNSTTQPNAFSGGHNLHALTLNNFTSLVVPVFPPSC